MRKSDPEKMTVVVVYDVRVQKMMQEAIEKDPSEMMLLVVMQEVIEIN